LLAIADGAGSASHAAQAATSAVESAIRTLNCCFGSADFVADRGEQAMRDAFADARATLLAMAASMEVDPRQLATTLTCAAVSTNGLFVGQIGDGMVIAEQPNGSLVAASQPQRGEYANETHFLTQKDALAKVVVTSADSVRSIIMLTDGLLPVVVAFPSLLPWEPFCRPLIEFVAKTDDVVHANGALTDLLCADRIRARTDDDLSIILLTRSLHPQIEGRAEDRVP
jgi:hypothetical protein